MSEKARDSKGRWRSISVSFRVSPEERDLMNRMARLSGLSKQEYLARRVTQTDVVVYPNARIYKALKEEMAQLRAALQKIQCEYDDDLKERLTVVTSVIGALDEPPGKRRR